MCVGAADCVCVCVRRVTVVFLNTVCVCEIIAPPARTWASLLQSVAFTGTVTVFQVATIAFKLYCMRCRVVCTGRWWLRASP